jgi:hypothetical protein
MSSIRLDLSAAEPKAGANGRFSLAGIQMARTCSACSCFPKISAARAFRFTCRPVSSWAFARAFSRAANFCADFGGAAMLGPSPKVIRGPAQRLAPGRFRGLRLAPHRSSLALGLAADRHQAKLAVPRRTAERRTRAEVARLLSTFGFAAVDVGSLREGGRLMQLDGYLNALHVLKQD